MTTLPAGTHPKVLKRLIVKEREKAYRQTSDHLFMEAIRKDAAGDIEGAEVARAQALQAVADIKAQYPLPENA